MFLAFAWAPGPAHGGDASPSDRTTHELAIAPPTIFSFRVWAVLYMLCGFISLSLEVLWFRVLGVVLKSNSFTFGILLALYLSGVGGGALLANRWLRRVPTPGAAFLLLQSGIGLYAGLSLALLANAVHTDALSFLLKDHLRPEIATSVFVNGLGQSQVPYGGGHTRLGMLPVLLHPHPRSLAIIGLGSGDTVFAAGGRQETERIDCIEIIRPQLETLRSLERRRIYPGLTALLEDPRVHYSFTDGRVFVGRMSRSYDVIEADALRPTSAYAGNLYSREYFELIRSRLAPGGMGVTWGPTPRICDTFLSVFPHVLRFDDILIGSDGPIAFDRAALQARLDDPFTQAYYRRAGVDPAQQLHAFLVAGPTVYGPGIDRSSLTDLNTDLFPKDEYGVPQSLSEYRIAQRRNP